MSRLLFAAARGARLQYLSMVTRKWESLNFIPCENYDYRIHLDDAALAYGPISTVLREMAIDGNIWKGVEVGMWNCMALPNIAQLTVRYHTDSELHRSLFLLILAEALADEGL